MRYRNGQKIPWTNFSDIANRLIGKGAAAVTRALWKGVTSLAKSFFNWLKK